MPKTEIFQPAEILLPQEGTDYERWACVACDQFTSEPEYWRQADAFVGTAPSTLRMILPEAYLEAPDAARRIERAHQAMEQYAGGLLTQKVRGFVYVERTTSSGLRQGLVGAVDLEAYSYEPGAGPAVRPSERTVTQRIPPRLAVRQGGCLEAPHILLLIDDADASVLEPLAREKQRLRPLYDTPLMLGGGRCAGWAVEGPALVERLAAKVDALGSQEAFDRRYPRAAGRAPFTAAVGDGNHSLATAKAYWEAVKLTLRPEERERHPARLCLVELCNLHSPAIGIEAIHRAVTGVTFDRLCEDFTAWLDARGAVRRAGAAAQRLEVLSPDGRSRALAWDNGPEPLAVGTLEAFLAEWMPGCPQAAVDYIHGEASLRGLCAQGAVGILLPDPAKSGLLEGVALGGVLPKKTFSMGHAQEKRYYLECRRIVP